MLPVSSIIRRDKLSLSLEIYHNRIGTIMMRIPTVNEQMVSTIRWFTYILFP